MERHTTAYLGAWRGSSQTAVESRLSAVLVLAAMLVGQTAWAWPNLKVVKSGPTLAAPGDVITYTLTYSNIGPVKSTSVVLKDFLPPDTAALTNTLGGGSLSGSTISWNLGTVSSKASGSKSFQVRVRTNTPSAGYLTNRAQIFGAEAEETGKTNDNYSTWITCITNRPPIAAEDFYTTAENTLLTIAAPGILANDSDPDGNGLTARLISDPIHGALNLSADGGFAYTPTANYQGLDSFSYKAYDGTTNSGVATVRITVTPVNDAPVAVDDNYATPEDTTLTIPDAGVLLNDTDADGDSLKALYVSGPSHGSLTLSLNGGFNYTPTNDYVGPDSFTYQAYDGTTNSGVATVRITVTPVNDGPVAVDDSYTTPEDTALTISAPGVLSNDSDVDGDPLTALITGLPNHGTLVLSTNGGFIYKPTTNFAGADSFTYRANDGQASSDLATVHIVVTPANDPPLAVDDNYTTTEDALLTIAAPGVLGNDSDPDDDVLSAALLSNPSHGSLVFNTSGSFTYLPATNFNGLDSFTYRASDGQLDSSAATVTVRVIPVNDAPDTNNWSGSSYSINEDTTLIVNAPGVLAGIVDVDGDALSVSLASNALHGEVSLNPDGSFSYLPETNYFGLDSFQFTVSDGQASTAVLLASITVVPVNDPPSFTKGGNQLVQLNSGPQTMPSWATAISPGPQNESDQTVSFLVSNDKNALFSTQPAINASGTLSYTPAPDASGTAVVTVVARDNGGTANGGVDSSAPQTFTIFVNAPPTVSLVSPTNGAFFFAPASFTVLADANDVDGTVTNVAFYADTNKLADANLGEPYFIVQTNLAVGSYTYGATATDDLGATGAAAPITVNVIERPPLTLLTAVYYNPQNDFFEQRVRITNPTYSTLDAVRVLVYNLTNTPPITVHNASGNTKGTPYVQTPATVPPGSYVDMTIEYHSPLRILPHTILRAELVPPAHPGPVILDGQPQRINRQLLLANRTLLLEFTTLSNRVYAIQYSPDMMDRKSAQPFVTGDGNWVQWIDNGLPKTESAPAATPSRFYRLILLP